MSSDSVATIYAAHPVGSGELLVHTTETQNAVKR